jgi:guanylate kinase
MAELVSARIRRRGLMLVLSSPSGAGKSTIARNLLESDAAITLSVSATTRPRRGSEIDGVHYHFASKREFDRLKDGDELLEWAEVHGNGYGTPKKSVEKFLRAGKDVIFDIDWQGTLQLYKAARKDVVGVFVLPPTALDLRERLARRAEDNQEVIERRLRNAIEELEHWREYDYILVNDDLDRTFRALKAILAAERRRRAPRAASGGRALEDAALASRMRRDSQPELGDLVKKLQSEL